MKKFLIAFAFTIAIVFVYVQVVGSDEATIFKVKNNVLYMDGLITSDTPQQLVEVFKNNPNITQLVMQTVEGSMDDEANLQAATWISKKQLTFILKSDSLIASGGTDFFLAGKIRIIKKGAKIGVHSWAGDNEVATDFPVGHAYHQPYIDYYIAIGWSDDAAKKFYYFTINAAPADSIYWMTEKELKDYSIVSKR